MNEKSEVTRFEKGVGLLRITLGAGFLYAGLEKVLRLGGGGPFNAAGFLKFATGGALPGSDPKAIVNPTRDFWVSLAGNADALSAINFLVQFGEIAIGVALILGLATRFAGICGVVMMAAFYIANWSFATGPFNEQFMYGILAAVVAYTGAGEHYGLDEIVERLSFVKQHPRLRFVLE
ncbi:MAG TPA: TQO small subunit DoxD [Candidatus Saccharimonadales bacterium]|nr:TQO small subunit DoxD [Candidatus Saccharimonadales bacterium]